MVGFGDEPRQDTIAPAGAEFCGGLLANDYVFGGFTTSGNEGGVVEFFCVQVIPQGKYPFIQSDSNNMLTTYYYLEEDA